MTDRQDELDKEKAEAQAAYDRAQASVAPMVETDEKFIEKVEGEADAVRP